MGKLARRLEGLELGRYDAACAENDIDLDLPPELTEAGEDGWAEAQGSRLFRLRAANDLARLLVEKDRREEARDLLAPIRGSFEEGFDAPDLREAKAILDELS